MITLFTLFCPIIAKKFWCWATIYFAINHNIKRVIGYAINQLTYLLFQEVSDVCIGTSIGTITEPDCLGPCEPGTSVTLEGIVWHETEGGEYNNHSIETA